MLAGINSRWKQMVAYYFTELKLNVISITSDMGACNQALWRKMQVGAGRHKVIKNYISNPTDSMKKVYI
jgi:hypothetical protein